jgi:hypothetical protein
MRRAFLSKKIVKGFSLKLAFCAVSLVLFSTDQAEAKRNPPGCHNANAAAHNPNCQGGGGTHVTVAPKPATTSVQTVVVAPANAQTGQSTGSGTGTSTPAIVTAAPQQTFTGYSPYYVPTLAPPLVPSPVPQQVPNMVPQAKPYLVPNQIVTANPPQYLTGYSPYYVPVLAPTLVPNKVPYPVPNKAPQAIPNLVPNQIVTSNPPQSFTGYSPYTSVHVSVGKGQGKTSGVQLHPKQILLHNQKGAPITDGTGFVPPKPGHNLVYGYRAFHVDTNGVESICVLSGLGSREMNNQAGAKWRSGHTEVLHFRSTSTAHLPSNKAHTGNHCLVSAKKRISQ